MKRGLPTPPSPNVAASKYRVNIPGMEEAIWNPLYDYQTKASTATSLQRFFQDPIGTNSKTVSDTNMELSGQIPKGQMFIITGIQVEFYPGVTINGTAASDFADDVYDFYKTGALKLNIGSKSFITQGNLMKFSPVNRLVIEAATTVSTDSYGYATAAGREFTVKGLMLESNQNFNVELIDTAALPSGSSARVGVTLNGWLYRNAQ